MHQKKVSQSELNQAFEIMELYPFATMITVVDGEPLISHLPLTAKKHGDGLELIGHLSRANPHSRTIANAGATVIFQGANCYITPRWYSENDVPTWNYSVAQVKGKIHLVENQKDLVQCLKELTNQVEKLWPSGWDFFIPFDLQGEELANNIVGFKIKVDEVRLKKKLSQNRSPADRAGVLKGLETRDDENSKFVLKEMKKIYSENGEIKK